MDKEFLKENNLMEAHKQFMRLCEWSFENRSQPWDIDARYDDDNSSMSVETEADEPQDPSMGEDPNGGAPIDNPSMGGGDPNGGDIPPMDDPNGGAPMDDPSMGDGDPNGGDMSPMDDPNGGAPMDDPSMGGDPNSGDMPPMDEPMDDQSQDDVIDVDDITNAQEKMNAKVNSVGKGMEDIDDKIKSLMQAVSSMEAMINQNNSDIQDFKREFEKRNPTQTEKLNLRSLDSAPFNEKPKDWWEKENANGRYTAYADNDEPTGAPRYITNSDVDDFDEKKVADSFFIDDDMIQSINKIFDL